MATITWNPTAWAEIDTLAEATLVAYGQHALAQMKAKAAAPDPTMTGYVKTGLLADSLDFTAPSWTGDLVEITFHDGPGADGKTYGAAEEVMRGGAHAFMRPTIDATYPDLPGDVRRVFAGGATEALRSSAAWPRAAGDWRPIPGWKVYKF